MVEGSGEVLGGWYLTAEVPWEVRRGLVPLCQEVWEGAGWCWNLITKAPCRFL